MLVIVLLIVQMDNMNMLINLILHAKIVNLPVKHAIKTQMIVRLVFLVSLKKLTKIYVSKIVVVDNIMIKVHYNVLNVQILAKIVNNLQYHV